MSIKLNIDDFLKCKYNNECLILDSIIINNILDLISNNDNKNKKSKIYQKKVSNVLKNPKIKLLKDKISNKVNLILNKLSENNIDNLVIEFMKNVKIYNIDDYNEFIKAFYIKIISEINFLDNYLNFFYIIISTYKQVYNYDYDYFYNLIECKFKYDYEDIIDTNYDFIHLIVDNRLNNLTLIKYMIKYNYFDISFEKYIENYILNQTKYLSDIYFLLKDKDLSIEYKNKIKLILSEDIQLRDKILIENLLGNSNVPNKIIIKSKIVKEEIPDINKNNIELENMLEEYLFINNSESLEEYITTNCVNANIKNKFCEFLMERYFISKSEVSKQICNLLKHLIKNKYLFKSNLSRGLLNCYKSNFNNDKLKTLLLFLKNLGITNGLENMMKKSDL
jgi:hypothetical protein